MQQFKYQANTRSTRNKYYKKKLIMNFHLLLATYVKIVNVLNKY